MGNWSIRAEHISKAISRPKSWISMEKKNGMTDFLFFVVIIMPLYLELANHTVLCDPKNFLHALDYIFIVCIVLSAYIAFSLYHCISLF
jgi:hypothetical protein